MYRYIQRQSVPYHTQPYQCYGHKTKHDKCGKIRATSREYVYLNFIEQVRDRVHTHTHTKNWNHSRHVTRKLATNRDRNNVIAGPALYVEPAPEGAAPGVPEPPAAADN